MTEQMWPTTRMVLINEAMAEHFWPGGSRLATISTQDFNWTTDTVANNCCVWSVLNTWSDVDPPEIYYHRTQPHLDQYWSFAPLAIRRLISIARASARA